MGRQIVYCEGCGHNLREDDFEKGRARMLDNKPFCIECRPVEPDEEPQPQQGRRSSSGKIPAQSRKNTTGSIPIIAAPRRPAAAQSNPMMLYAAIGGVIVLILIVVVMQSGSKKPPVVETAPIPRPEPPIGRRVDPPAPPTPPPTPPPPPPPVVRTPQPPSPPPGPLVAPTASEKLDAFIAQIRGMIQSDASFERIDEILNMFSAASKSAGPRAAEIAKMKSDYIATLPEAARAAASWSDWRITSSGDPQQTQMLASHNGRNNVQMTHPVDRQTGARLERDVDVPAGKKSTFSFWVSCHQMGDFELRVYVDGKQVVKKMIGPPGSGWRQETLDLTPYAGKRIALRVENFPNDWSWEHAYWSDLVITSE